MKKLAGAPPLSYASSPLGVSVGQSFTGRCPRNQNMHGREDLSPNSTRKWSVRRRAILTKEVLATTIPGMVQLGLRGRDIAEQLGCKYSTLKVRCSQVGVSLKAAGSTRTRDYNMIRVDRRAITLLRDRAAASGKTASAVATELIEIIARDNIYDAVLDKN